MSCASRFPLLLDFVDVVLVDVVEEAGTRDLGAILINSRLLNVKT